MQTLRNTYYHYIILADHPLTDRPGKNLGLLSTAVNEGWVKTALEIT